MKKEEKYIIIGFLIAIIGLYIVACLVEQPVATGVNCSFSNVGLPNDAYCVVYQ
jgi:uncharacterized membrane protein YccC